MNRFILVAAAFFAFSSADALALNVGTSCSVVGQTQMDTDQNNIIACVCNTISNCETTGHINDLKWKVMSSGIACPSGQALTGIVNGQPVCKSSITFSGCPSGQVIKGVSNGTPYCGTL